jgi:hypothetical protein
MRAGSAGALFHSCDLYARGEKGEIGEEGTFPRRPDRFKRRREHLQGTAADGDALTNVSDPTFADQGQPNGKPAQREVRRPLRVAHERKIAAAV